MIDIPKKEQVATIQGNYRITPEKKEQMKEYTKKHGLSQKEFIDAAIDLMLGNPSPIPVREKVVTQGLSREDLVTVISEFVESQEGQAVLINTLRSETGTEYLKTLIRKELASILQSNL